MTWCLVGEPSSTDTLGDIVKNGRRGLPKCQTDCKRQQGHVAYPHLAINPIHTVSKALSELETVWDNGTNTSLQHHSKFQIFNQVQVQPTLFQVR